MRSATETVKNREEDMRESSSLRSAYNNALLGLSKPPAMPVVLTSMNRRLILCIIIVNFIAVLLFHLIALAATDAPHNASNNVNCGSCHGAGLS
jgi:hypothetical protein